MSLADVTGVVFFYDKFWSGLNSLNSLKMVISTCKGFKTSVDVKQAMRAMLETRSEPTMLRFSEAKYQFSLKPDAMVKFCSALPEDDIFRLTEEEAGRYKAGYFSPYIRFTDAFNLASKGLKAAMERRDRLDRKVLEDAREILDTYRRPLSRMLANTSAALEELTTAKKAQEEEKKKKQTPTQLELSKGVRLLTSLRNDIQLKTLFLRSIHGGVRSPPHSTPRMMRLLDDLKANMKALNERYKTHGEKFCPGKMIALE